MDKTYVEGWKKVDSRLCDLRIKLMEAYSEEYYRRCEDRIRLSEVLTNLDTLKRISDQSFVHGEDPEITNRLLDEFTDTEISPLLSQYHSS